MGMILGVAAGRRHLRPEGQLGKLAQLGREDMSADGPRVDLLYESETERDELLSRLRQAGLGELPMVMIDLGPDEAPGSRLTAAPRSLARVSEALGTSAVVAMGFLSSRWMFVVAMMLTIGPLFLITRRVLRTGRFAGARA
jgi:hypothetical protein